MDRLMACPPKSVSRSKWLEMPFPFQAPSLARIVPSSLSFVRSSVRSLNPATSRINIPNNHAGRVTNAVPAPLAANWTRSGMLAQVLSYASVGDSQFSVVIATGRTKLFQLFLRFQRRFLSRETKPEAQWTDGGHGLCRG